MVYVLRKTFQISIDQQMVKQKLTAAVELYPGPVLRIMQPLVLIAINIYQ